MDNGLAELMRGEIVGTSEEVTGSVVRAAGLRKEFIRAGGEIVRAIDDVWFDIAPGEFVVLLGPSGCGKTTLLRSLAGLERPDAGRLELHEKVVFSSDDGVNVPTEKRSLSMVFQSYALWPHMTVAENVAYPLKSNRKHKPPRSKLDGRVAKVLDQVGIPKLGDQYPNQLSGGQQQRVALARALIVESNLVLFDEPLSNVDAKVREELRLELATMQRELGFSAVFVTHDQTEAMVLADRIAVLDSGRIVQMASPADIYNEPETRYVANFIGTANEVEGQLMAVDSGEAVLQSSVGEVRGILIDKDLQVGSGAVAVWRPERFRRISSPQGRPNEWRGTIAASAFHGPSTEHIVKCAEAEFRVWEAASLPAEAGSEVLLSVSPNDIRILALE